MRHPHLLPVLCAAVAVATFAPPAGATPTFPQVIADTLGLATPPHCTICHQTDQGGIGTSTRPFSLYLQSRGLRPYDEGSLKNALAAAVAEHHDSNGNGVSDIDELKAGLDPNGAKDEPPRYGCGARIAGSRRVSAPAAVLSSFALLLFARGRRRVAGQR